MKRSLLMSFAVAATVGLFASSISWGELAGTAQAVNRVGSIANYVGAFQCPTRLTDGKILDSRIVTEINRNNLTLPTSTNLTLRTTATMGSPAEAHYEVTLPFGTLANALVGATVVDARGVRQDKADVVASIISLIAGRYNADPAFLQRRTYEIAIDDHGELVNVHVYNVADRSLADSTFYLTLDLPVGLFNQVKTAVSGGPRVLPTLNPAVEWLN
jgi:hypothetical protein